MGSLTGIFKGNDRPIKNFDDFWAWFQKNEKTFFKVVATETDIEKNFFNKISPKLAVLNDGFFYLTGMFDDQTAELILTPDGIVKNVVFVEELVNAAPRIQGWRFTALKPALDIENIKIDMNGVEFSKDTLSFYSNENPAYPDEIDVVVVHRNFRDEDNGRISPGVYIFLDNFLGELEFITTIDILTVIGNDKAEKELIPIEKLKAFLIWRQKEFLEKYQGQRHDTENDTYSTFETELKNNGRKLIAVINTTLLDWDRKASHPWFMTVTINYKGDENNGMPDDQTYKTMDILEDEIMLELQDFDGYLNVGRETGDNLREIYFACKDFRKPSKLLHKLAVKYLNILDVSYDIFKDKYWKKMERYR